MTAVCRARRCLLQFGRCVSFAMLGPQEFRGLPYMNPALPVDVRVDDLVGRMTLEEKNSQTQNNAPHHRAGRFRPFGGRQAAGIHRDRGHNDNKSPDGLFHRHRQPCRTRALSGSPVSVSSFIKREGNKKE